MTTEQPPPTPLLKERWESYCIDAGVTQENRSQPPSIIENRVGLAKKNFLGR